ncbi:MAG: hypothetical protein HY084_01730 [Gemmatimonadetes bacterium]|nr:hypothetical protein [Gemmatimonadota bacterium]
MLRRLRLVLCALLPVAASAQGVRVTGVTYIQTVELRPLVNDSISTYYTTGSGEWRTLADGTPVRCLSGNDFCTYQRSGANIFAAPLVQDLSFASWGIGEGLSIHADVRGRTQLTTEGLIYPRGDRNFELMDAYAELERSWGRGRLGRQWLTGALGVYTFDGADLMLRRNKFSVEGWAGRALEAGLNNTFASAELAGIENIPPDQDGYIFGVRGRFRPDAITAVSATYQRVLIADHSGLYSERAAFDATTRTHGAAIDVAGTYDFVTGEWNEARLRVGRAGLHALGVSAEVRHSVPFFETWTIWGAFTPVGFNEARATLDWRMQGMPIVISAHGAYRKYAGTDAGLTLRTNGWRAGADVMWQGSGAISGYASYDVDIGDGASSNDVRATLRWSGDGERTFGITGSAVQNIYEFRIGTGRVIGGGVDAAWPIAPDLRLMADWGLYRQLFSIGAPGPDWTQRRASVRLEWTLGRDPGLAGKGK